MGAPATTPPPAHALTAAADIAAGAPAERVRNTSRCYAGALERLHRHLRRRRITDKRLAAYLAAQFDSGRALSTLTMTTAAVNAEARDRGETSPVGKRTRAVLAHARRRGRNRGRGQATGAGWKIADRAASIAAKDNRPLVAARDAALILTASDAMLRIAEAAALDIGDIDLAERTATVRQSKTDRTAAGADLYLRETTADTLKRWLELSELKTGGLFRAIDRRGKIRDRLSAESVRRIIVKRLRAAGATGRISGHSLRVGATQDLARAGATLPELQIAGRWTSTAMPARYARKQAARHGAVARLRPETEHPHFPPGT